LQAARPALRPGAHAATPPRRVPLNSRAAERPAPRAPQAGSTPLCPDVKIRPSCARPPSSRQAALLPPPTALLPPPAAESALLPPPAALLPPAARARPGQADRRQSVLNSSPAQPRPVPATTAVLQPQQPLPRGHPAVPRRADPPGGPAPLLFRVSQRPCCPVPWTPDAVHSAAPAVPRPAIQSAPPCAGLHRSP
jgi:hypothetical protein